MVSEYDYLADQEAMMSKLSYAGQMKAYGEITDPSIVCPYCFEEDEAPWEHNLRDGDRTEVTCGGCDKKFKVVCSINVDYTSRKIEDKG